MLHKEFKIVFVNENMIKVLGYTCEEIVDKPYAYFLVEDQLFDNVINRIK